jgi:hypothetical protein
MCRPNTRIACRTSRKNSFYFLGPDRGRCERREGASRRRRLAPVVAIQTAILDRLGQLLGPDRFRAA